MRKGNVSDGKGQDVAVYLIVSFSWYTKFERGAGVRRTPYSLLVSSGWLRVNLRLRR